MNIVIAGGGDVGVSIAQKLIFENHNVTIIEQDERTVKNLRNKLDALIIPGNAVDINTLKEANIERASYFFAVTNAENINIIASTITKKLNSNIFTICKIVNSSLFFDNKRVSPADFNVDMVIDPKELSITKIMTLINHPEAVEMLSYEDDRILLTGLVVNGNFKYIGKSLNELSRLDKIFKEIRIVAIYRNDEIIIPRGNDVIARRDKLYIIGKTNIINKVMKNYFSTDIRLNNIIIIGGNKIGESLARRLIENKKKVTIIEESMSRCKELSREISGALILNGSGTDTEVLKEVEIDNSCVVCLTDDDEYNIIAAVTAKNYDAIKTICLIRNTALGPIINSTTPIDTVFSPHVLSSGEILQFCRKGNIVSVTYFSEIDAETITIVLSQSIPILEKPIKDIKFPDKMIIGLIVRDDQVIIPTGNDVLKLNDKLILFILPEAIDEADILFKQNLIRVK